MKQIDILTSNNVTIQYQLASLLQRGVAFLLDTVFLWVFYIILIYFIVGLAMGGVDEPTVYWTIVIVFFIPAYVFYDLICEVFFKGQSAGKAIMSIRVVKANGQLAEPGDYFIRWAYRLVDVGMSLGGIAAIFISSSQNSQRLGDMAANTVVIKTKPENRYHLRDILQLTKKDYEPTYPQVTSLSDEDLLLIKNAIDKVQSYPNDANKKFVLKLVKKTAELLNIEEIPKNKITFLKTLLKDYVMLTR